MKENSMNIIILLIMNAMLIAGCASTPYEKLNLDTTSNFNKPKKGMAGIYVYQWKTGVLGAAFDVDFEVKGYPELSLNTGEYGYFEVLPGSYEYKLSGGIFKQYDSVRFEANQNYFFRAALLNASDFAILIRDQMEIDEAKKYIKSGRYEKNSKD